MIPAMGRDRTQQTTSDLFSTASFRETSSPAKQVSSAPERRHVLPRDLPSAVKHLDDEELDRLLAAALAEARRRGRCSFPTDKPSPQRQPDAVAVSLTRGQVNAVRAAFKAGITLSRIARQFGLSQSDVRKALATDASG
jgi:predicted DNA binding protein